MGYTEDSVREDCVADLDAQKEYLGPLNVNLYFNNEKFDKQAYGEETIKRESSLI